MDIMDINDVYEQVLGLAGLYTDQDGVVYHDLNATRAATIGGKNIVLLTDAQCKDTKDACWKSRVPFNPLVEQLDATELTPLVDWYRHALSARLTILTTVLVTEILRVAASHATHANLTPAQTKLICEVLPPIKEIDYTSIRDYLFEVAKQTPLVTLVSYRDATVPGKQDKFARACHVKYVLYQELKKNPDFKPGKKSLTKGRVAILLKLLDAVFGTEDDASTGSNSRVAPFFESLVLTATMVSSKIYQSMAIWPELCGVDDASPSYMNVVDEAWQNALWNDIDALSAKARKLPNVRVPETTADTPGRQKLASKQEQQTQHQQAPQVSGALPNAALLARQRAMSAPRQPTPVTVLPWEDMPAPNTPLRSTIPSQTQPLRQVAQSQAPAHLNLLASLGCDIGQSQPVSPLQNNIGLSRPLMQSGRSFY